MAGTAGTRVAEMAQKRRLEGFNTHTRERGMT